MIIRLSHQYKLPKRARILRFFWSLIRGGIIIGMSEALAYIIGAPFLLPCGWIVAGALVMVSTIGGERFSYIFLEKTFVVRCGVIFSGHDVIPYSRIASLSASSGIGEKICGLCSLHIHVPRVRIGADFASPRHSILCARRGTDEFVIPISCKRLPWVMEFIKNKQKECGTSDD